MGKQATERTGRPLEHPSVALVARWRPEGMTVAQIAQRAGCPRTVQRRIDAVGGARHRHARKQAVANTCNSEHPNT